jgi:nucleoside-diphosphate-sugar epimerase
VQREHHHGDTSQQTEHVTTILTDPGAEAEDESKWLEVSRLSDSEIARRPWVIIGCGYTGTRLARRLLAAGASVRATRRTPEATRELAAELGDVADGRLATLPLDLATLATPATPVTGAAGAAGAAGAGEQGQLTAWLPVGAIIVDAAPPALGDTSGETHLVACARAADARRIVYISSTSVYPPGDGSWTDEDAPVAPASDQGQARLAAESAIFEGARAGAIEAVSLRAAGIYGPGRGVPTRLHQGTYRIIGDGDTLVSRIHVDDLVAIILAAATAPSLPRTVYNVADDEPETSRAYAYAVADILGVPRPPSVPVSAVDPWIASMMRANRRISNQRLKQELGVELAYPTWREGLAQVMAEEGIPGAGGRDGRAAPTRPSR